MPLLSEDMLPATLADEAAVEDILSTPSQALVNDLARLDGDILVLGVGGKVGPTLARLAKRAAPDKRVVGVARFSNTAVRERLKSWGVETIACDLLDRDAVAGSARRIRQFLRRARAHLRTWLGDVRHARPPDPPRLRHRHAVRRAARDRHQGALRRGNRLEHEPHLDHLARGCEQPDSALPLPLHDAHQPPQHHRPAIVSVRELAESFAQRMDKPARYAGQEGDSAWVMNGEAATALFGDPVVTTEKMLDWVADWVMRDMPNYGKPTKYDVRSGRF
ncbi:MAG: hypothetical protein QGF53_01710 [Alphaproteobacteria bacterium]|jgi:hypothetical protein|nr:hypothetical protein [Alphaproteobacteria bacterium]